MELLGLDDEELCAALGAEPLEVVSGEVESRPELPVLLDLLEEARERVGAPVLRAWVRTAGHGGRPLDLLLDRDYAGFESALDELEAHGWVIRGGGSSGG
jgi:hypothetical protein